MPAEAHRHKVLSNIPCAVVTASDTRTEADDKSGKIIKDALTAGGHEIAHYEIIPDDPERISALVMRLSETESIKAILITGGTGIAPRDNTYDAVVGLLDKKIDGFGELFRYLSYEEIGAGAMLSRAVAGVANRTLVFCMPGSTAAVRLAMEKLISPELPHLAWLLQS